MKLRPAYFSKYDVALFIDEKGKTRWKHLLKEFVESGSEKHISKQRLSNYLKELVAEGLVKKTIDTKALMLRMVWRIYPIYIVPKNRKKRLQEIRDKKKIFEFLDAADPEKIGRLKREIERLTEA